MVDEEQRGQTNTLKKRQKAGDTNPRFLSELSE